MTTFRGLICNNEADYRGKERALFNLINAINDETNGKPCTSQFYSGANGKADLYTIDDKPILVEPKNPLFKAEADKLPLIFTDLDTSIIRQDEI